MHGWPVGVLAGMLLFSGCGGKTSSHDDEDTAGGTAGTHNGGSSARGGGGSSAGTSPGESWTLQLGGYATDGAFAVGVAPDDDILVLFVNDAGLSTPPKPLLEKLDPSGKLVWSTPVTRGTPGILAVGPYGDTVIAGSDESTDAMGIRNDNLVVTTYDENGKVGWSSTLGSDGLDSAIALSVSPEGHAFLLWSGTIGATSAVVSELDLNGNVMTRNPVPEDAGVVLPTLDRDGNVLGITGTDPYSARKVDANGDELWTTRVTGIPLAIAADDAGNVLVWTTVFETSHAIVTKLDADGNLLWSEDFGVGTETPGQLTGDALGHAFTVGPVSYDEGATFDILSHRFDVDGSVLSVWSLGSELRDFPNGIATDSTGALIVVGTTAGALPGNQSHGGTDAFVARVAY